MNDLLARLAQRPPISAPRGESLFHRDQFEEMRDTWALRRAEFDRDLALDALAALCRLEADGKHADECSIEAWETAQAILRELRGATSGEGDRLG